MHAEFSLPKFAHPLPSFARYDLPFRFRHSLRTSRARKRTFPDVRERARAFTRASRDFKFLLLYGSSDVCRREAAPGVSTSAEKPFREIRTARRGRGATFESNPSYGSTGNTFIQGYAFPALEIPVQLHWEKYWRVDSLPCSRAPGTRERIDEETGASSSETRNSSCALGATTRSTAFSRCRSEWILPPIPSC